MATLRISRAQVAWKVPSHTFSAGGPSSARTRSRISAAALFVKALAGSIGGAMPGVGGGVRIRPS